MAGKTSTLVWDTPPDGGSDITEYRVLVFEEQTLVATLTSEDPMVDVEHSETVDRLALIQASNEQGYSAPLEFTIPPAPAGISIQLSGGGTLAAGGTAGGDAPATLPAGVTLPTIEIVSVTATVVNYRFTAVGSGYDQQQVILNSEGAAVDVHGSSAKPNVGDTASFAGLTPSTDYSLQVAIIYTDPATSQQADSYGPEITFTTSASTPPAGGTPTFKAPVIAASRSGSTITVTETTPGALITTSALFRSIGGTFYQQQSPANLPFSEVDSDAHDYFVRVSDGTTSLDSNRVSVAAYTAPPASGGTVAQGGTFQAGLIETAPQFTADGVAIWSTANKTASANETTFTTQLNRARIPMWFKFYLPASQTIRLSGLPSNVNMGFTGQDSADGADTIAYLCAAASGNVTDADLVAGGLSEITNDDDSAGNQQPYINMTLGGGWYYILIARYQSNTTVADGRMAFRFMP